MTEYIQVITTVSTEEEAQTIATGLVEQRLAACVQVIGPILSTYRWNGDVERATEWLCLVKSRAELYDEVEKMIHLVHPYDVPEILAMPVVAGSARYLGWLGAQTRTAAG